MKNYFNDICIFFDSYGNISYYDITMIGLKSNKADELASEMKEQIMKVATKYAKKINEVL